jgi:hypothetical protein
MDHGLIEIDEPQNSFGSPMLPYFWRYHHGGIGMDMISKLIVNKKRFVFGHSTFKHFHELRGVLQCPITDDVFMP